MLKEFFFCTFFWLKQINGICSISCSYNCQNIYINASLSESLVITDCIDESCNDMTIYCPENNEPNSCQIHDSANSTDSTIISNIRIFANIAGNNSMNINITNNGLLSGYLHCNNNQNISCKIDPIYPSLCIGGQSLNCNNNDNDEYYIMLTSENIHISNESIIKNNNTFWIEFIGISVGLSLISILCMFCCKMDNDQDKTNHDTKQQHFDKISNDKEYQSNIIHTTNKKQKEQAINDAALNNQNGKNNEITKLKERILSDTENNTDNEFEHDIDKRIKNFKHSLSIQIQNEMVMMDDVLKEIRRDSLYRIGDKIDINELKEENEPLQEEETDDTETDVDYDENEDFCVNV